jgi:ribosome-binding protein aMBF1 (putative translation factor)
MRKKKEPAAREKPASRNTRLPRAPRGDSEDLGEPRAIGDLIREARVRSGLTQADLAKRLGTTQQNVGYYESTRSNPSVRALLELAEAIGAELVLRIEV